MRKFILLTAIILTACNNQDDEILRLNNIINQFESRLVKATRLNDDLTSAKEALLIEIDYKVAEISAINSLNDSLSVDNGVLKSRIDVLLSDIEILNGEVSELNGSLDIANGMIVDLTNQNEVLESDIDALRMLNAELIRDYESIISGLEFELNGMYDEVDGLRAENAILAANLQAKIAKVKKLRQRKNTLKAKLNDSNNSNDYLNGQVDYLNSQVDWLEGQICQKIHQAIFAYNNTIARCNSQNMNSLNCQDARKWGAFFVDLWNSNGCK